MKWVKAACDIPGTTASTWTHIFNFGCDKVKFNASFPFS
jgi:hypothetical protein